MAYLMMFDRSIDLDLYDETGKLITSIVTPTSGRKPDITWKTTAVSSSLGVSTEIIVTNFEGAFPLEQVEYIHLSAYYNGLKDVVFANKGQFIYHVLDSKEVKQPPDRQFSFNCVEAGIDVSIMGGAFGFTPPVGDNGKLQAVSLDTALKSWIESYNSTITSSTTYSRVSASSDLGRLMRSYLLLDTSVDYSYADAGAGNTQIKWANDDASLYNGWNELQMAIQQTEKIGDNTVSYNKYKFYLQQDMSGLGKVFVTNNVYSGMTSQIQATDPRVYKLDYVLSGYRSADVVDISTMYDPRFRPFGQVAIKKSALLGHKKSAGDKILPTTQEYVTIQLISGTKISFGTIRNNRMDMQGVVINK